MTPFDVVDGIREYTGESGVDVKNLKVAENVINDITGYILGLIVFVISLGITVITALDVAYITLPLFQEKVQNKRWDGSNGLKSFRLISNDARLAVNEASTISSGKSALSIYLAKRIKTYMICGAVIYICLGGSGAITPFIAKVVRAILDAFNIIIN